MIAGIGLLVFLIAVSVGIYAFMRSSALRQATYVTPLLDGAPHLPVRFDAPGVYVLYHEVAHAARWLKRWRYLLWDNSTQTYIESRWAPNQKFPGTTATRWQVRFFDVPHAGDYQLVTEGLAPGDDVKVIIGRFSMAPGVWMSLGIVCMMAALITVIVTVIAIQ